MGSILPAASCCGSCCAEYDKLLAATRAKPGQYMSAPLTFLLLVIMLHDRYVADNPDLVIPEPLKQMEALAVRDYQQPATTPAATTTAATPAAEKAPAASPAGAAAVSGDGEANTGVAPFGSSSGGAGGNGAGSASFDSKPLAPVALPDLAGLSLGGPPPLNIPGRNQQRQQPGGGNGSSDRRLGGAAAVAAAVAADPASHHASFMLDPARAAEQQDR